MFHGHLTIVIEVASGQTGEWVVEVGMGVWGGGRFLHPFEWWWWWWWGERGLGGRERQTDRQRRRERQTDRQTDR